MSLKMLLPSSVENLNGKEDVVCRFKGIEAGYFKTQHLYDDETVKYRNASIESIYHIDITTINTKED